MTTETKASDGRGSTTDLGVWLLLSLILFHAHMNFRYTMKRLDALEAKIAPSAEQEQK
jgi:hypothetical protein